MHYINMSLALSEADPQCKLKYVICLVDSQSWTVTLEEPQGICLMQNINCLDFAKDLCFTYYQNEYTLSITDHIYGFYPEMIRCILEELRTERHLLPAIQFKVTTAKQKSKLKDVLAEIPEEAKQFVTVLESAAESTYVLIRLEGIHPVVFHALATGIRNTLIDKEIPYRGESVSAKYLIEYAMQANDIPMDDLLKAASAKYDDGTVDIGNLHNKVGSLSFLQRNLGEKLK